MMKTGKGLFVLYEGNTSSGKTLQIKKNAEDLARENIRCAVTKEPSDMPFGRVVREYIESKAKNVSADKLADAYEELQRLELPPRGCGKDFRYSE